jgi:hypothetical protein
MANGVEWEPLRTVRERELYADSAGAELLTAKRRRRDEETIASDIG